jgi:acetolactate synthase-1/2/3 large subunit
MHQEREYPARVYGTALRNPDFVMLAQAYGCHGERVTETAAFPAAFERARAAGSAALIELVIDPQAITAGQTIDELRAQAIARRAS